MSHSPSPFPSASPNPQPQQQLQPQGPPPPMPPGWIAQWDGNVGRWYVEQVSDRGAQDGYSSLSAPPQQQQGYQDSYYGGGGGGGGHGYPDVSGAPVVDEEKDKAKKEKKKKDGLGAGALVAAGVGGLAVGALGGALIAHELGKLLSSFPSPYYRHLLTLALWNSRRQLLLRRR